jgi:hypothetical protein
MADKHLISHDPEYGVTQYYSFDSITGERTLETVWSSDVDEVNPALYNTHSDHGPSRWKGDWHRVAQIPLVVLHELQKKGILNDNKAFAKWLNDSDNRLFRTMPGKV